MLRLLILFTTAIMAEVGIHATIEGPPCTYPGTERPPGYQGQPGVDYYAPGTHPDCPCLPSPPGTPGTPGSYCHKRPDVAHKNFVGLQSDTQQQVEAVPSPFCLHLSKASTKTFN